MSEKIRAYVGCRNGVRLYGYDKNTGRLSLEGETAESFNVSKMLLSQDEKYLYCTDFCADMPESRGGGGSRLFFYELNTHGRPTLRSVSKTLSAGAIDMMPSSNGKHLIVLHYGGNDAVTQIEADAYGEYFISVKFSDAAVSLFNLDNTQSIGALLDVNRHDGNGPNSDQLHAHPCSLAASNDGKYYAVCDSGSDEVYVYTIGDKKLCRVLEPYKLPAGASPKKCLFHPYNSCLYVSNDAMNAVTVLEFDNGRVTKKSDFSIIEDGNLSKGDISWMTLSQDGRYLYVLSPAARAVSTFQVERGGGLSLRQRLCVDGEDPTRCYLDPNGRVMLIICKDKVISNYVLNDGLIGALSAEIEIDGGNCIAFKQT